VDLASCDAATLRRARLMRIAMVFQQFALLPWRTVRENVGLGLELRGVSATERRRAVDEKLGLVGLDQWADRYAHELSGGMQQRVGLARAFATDADILLMDEPFSALDPLIRGKLQDELLDLQQKVKKTILFVSHDLDEAVKIGNHISIMEGGQIVQTGTAEDIVLRPANDYVAQFVQHLNPLTVLRAGTVMAALAGVGSAIAAWTGWGGLAGLVAPLFMFVSATGFIAANSIVGALALAPQRAGTVSALVGAVQYGSGMAGSALVGAFADGTPWPMGWVIALGGIGSAACAWLLLPAPAPACPRRSGRFKRLPTMNAPICCSWADPQQGTTQITHSCSASYNLARHGTKIDPMLQELRFRYNISETRDLPTPWTTKPPPAAPSPRPC
jgi:ABC-type nitrate/sulfonate/bicarbonate transport system ATPase subunit